jgi:hypothetical protein
MPRIHSRQRQGISIIALIYLVGYALGRAAGKEQIVREIVHGAGRGSS